MATAVDSAVVVDEPRFPAADSATTTSSGRAATSALPLSGSLTPSESRSVLADIHYSAALPGTAASAQWFVNINNTADSNYQTAAVRSRVYDMRGQEHLTHIDVTGFQALTAPSSVSSELLLSGQDDEIRRVYYPEVERLLLKQTGASRVVFFDHTVRKVREGVTETDPSNRAAVLRAHVDQTPASALKRVARHVQPPQPYRRVQLINVWRPIANAVYDFPLAVCDFRSVDVDAELEPTVLRYPPPLPNGETYSVKHSPAHRWYYWSEMSPSSVLLIKCYDSASRQLSTVRRSAADVDPAELRDVAGLTPHTAFKDEEGAKKGIKRQSIEVRALVFYD